MATIPPCTRWTWRFDLLFCHGHATQMPVTRCKPTQKQHKQQQPSDRHRQATCLQQQARTQTGAQPTRVLLHIRHLTLNQASPAAATTGEHALKYNARAHASRRPSDHNSITNHRKTCAQLNHESVFELLQAETRVLGYADALSFNLSAPRSYVARVWFAH